jgi:hypothetical protein
METYRIEDACSFYSLKRLAPYVLSISAFLFLVQLILFALNLRFFSTSQVERYLVNRKAGNSDLVAFRKARSLP